MSDCFSEKSCGNCTHCHSYNYSGSFDDPPDEGWECQIEQNNPYRNVIENLISLHDEKTATWCKLYDEKMIDNCRFCQQPINAPQATWELWANDWDYEPFAVCSNECKELQNAASNAIRQNMNIDVCTELGLY